MRAPDRAETKEIRRLIEKPILNDRDVDRMRRHLGRIVGVRTCRECGCTDKRACMTPAGPCHWAEEDLCSACADKGGETR